MTKPHKPKLLMVALALLCGACASTSGNRQNNPAEASQPDYTMLQYWAAHPWVHDPSDSTPDLYQPLETDTTVDVFFIHPTTYTRRSAVRGKPYSMTYWNARIEDSGLNVRTDQSAILYQASAFNQYRVFAPRYRQAHIEAFFRPDSLVKPFFDTAYADVKAAFQQYLAQYNQGRPFIIAAHSQGTRHAARLLREEIEGRPWMNRLVAAYLPGLPVRPDLFDHLQPCDRPDQTGCITSWRTFRKGYVPKTIQQESFAVININPLSFDAAVPAAGRDNNQGSIFWEFNKPMPHNVAAEVHGHVLWSTKPKFFGNIFLTRRNYHIGDINLFWKNIRDNAATRVAAYKKSHP